MRQIEEMNFGCDWVIRLNYYIKKIRNAQLQGNSKRFSFQNVIFRLANRLRSWNFQIKCQMKGIFVCQKFCLWFWPCAIRCSISSPRWTPEMLKHGRTLIQARNGTLFLIAIEKLPAARWRLSLFSTRRSYVDDRASSATFSLSADFACPYKPLIPLLLIIGYEPMSSTTSVRLRFSIPPHE